MRFNSLMEPSSACSYVATQRGGVALLFEGHRYNKVRDGKDGTVYWRCSRDRQCPGRAVTVNNRVKKSNNKHNHPPEASLMLRNGGANNATVTGNNNSSTGGSSAGNRANSNANSNAATFRYSGNNESSSMMAAAYASFLQGSNNNQTNHGNSNKSSHSSNNSISITPQPRIPPIHNSQPTSATSPLELAAIGTGANNNFSSAFSFLQNLASSNYANNSSHLLPNNPLFSNHSSEFARQTAMNLSSNNNNVDNNNLYSLSNHLNLLNNRNSFESSTFKLSSNQNSRPPTPTSHLLNKTFYHQYNKLLKNKCPSQNDNPFETFNSSAFNRLAANSPTNVRSSSTNPSANVKSSSSPTGPTAADLAFTLNQHSNTANDNAASYPENLAMLQDAFQEAQVAAVAAAAFPSLLNETFKFLSATAAATNPQVAAALANTLSNQNLFKNLDLTMATATAAAAVVAASTNSGNQSANVDKCSMNDLIDDHHHSSSFVSLGTKNQLTPPKKKQLIY